MAEFGKYILQRKLAEGGMAELFLAKQAGMEGFEKPVVVKRILPHLCHEENFIEMFLNEARVAARFSHPSIVQIFDLGRVADQYYIAMEYVQGEDLRSLAKHASKKNQPMPLALAVRIMADTLGALHYAHTRSGVDGQPLGLVHRDVSPQNVLVTYEGGVKLVDFGIAKATEAESGNQTQAGLLKGKYAYMSPEQCRGRKLDARSDIFAVGIILWELVTWQRLFLRDTDMATLLAVADDPILPLRSVRHDVPAELDAICACALERDPQRRYPTAQAMQAALEACIRKYAWEADSIALQQYMQRLFDDKLRAQEEAVRAAGVTSLEDLLVRVDEHTRLSWMDSSSARRPVVAATTPQYPAAAVPGQPMAPRPRTTSGPMVVAPTPPHTPSAPLEIAPTPRTPSMPLVIAPTPQPVGHVPQAAPPARAALPPVAAPSLGRRIAIIAITGVLITAVVLVALFWAG